MYKLFFRLNIRTNISIMSDKKDPIPETRVRKLKKDGSWIRKEDDSTTSKPVAPESNPLVKQNSFVLTAVKRYEPKEPTKHLVTLPGEKNKTGNVKTSPLVDSASLPKRVSNAKIKQKELAANEVQPLNDTGVEKGIMSTPEKATDLRLTQNTDNTKPVPPGDTDNQIALSKQDQKGIIKDTADVKTKSLPKAVNVETVTNETSLPNTQQPVVGGLSEVPAVKADIKITESSEDLAPLPEPSTVIRAERVAVCTPGDKTTAPNSEESCSQGLSKTPTGKAAITSGESEEKPVALPEPVSVVKAKSEVQLADDAPVGQGVESTPEQASEHTKTVVHLEPSPNTDTQTSSEQELNKIAKATAEVKEGSSPEVPSANIATETDETSLPNNMPSVLSGLPVVPSAIADFKSADSQEDPSPFPEPFIVVRAEKVDVSPVKDENTFLDNGKLVSNNSSQSPAPEALLKLTKTKEDSAATQEPSESEVQSIKGGVVEQMNEPAHQCTGYGNRELTRKENVEPLLSADNNNQTIPSDQDANKVAKSIGGIEVESSPEILSAKKETVTNETSPSKSMPSVPSGLSEAPPVKVDVKPANPETPAPLSEPTTMIRAEIATGCVPEDKTTPPKSEQPLSQDLSKTPTDKAAITSRKSEEKPVALPELLPALKAKSDEELADDAPVGPSVVSTPEQVSENLLKKPVKIDSSPNTDTQKSSEQDAKKVPKAAGDIEVKSSPEVPSTKKETVTNETSPSKSMPSVPSGLSEAPAVKVDVKPAESPETPAPLPGASTMIRVERTTGFVLEHKTAPPNSEQALSQDLSKTPTDKAAITSRKSEEKPVALPEPLPALKAKSDEELADDAPVEPSVVSTPEQVSENLLKKPVKVYSSPNADTQTSSEQDANKIAKAAGEIEVKSSPEALFTKKETVTNETSPSKSVPSVPSGLSEAPAAKVNVKSAESPETPAPLPGASTMIRAEIPTGCVPENKTTPPNSEKALSQDLSKTPTDKAAITSRKSEEKPVALPELLPALKAKSDEELADDAPVEPSVVSTPEQVSENLLKKPVKIDSSPNTDTQKSSEQDAKKLPKVAGDIEVKSSPEVPSTKKETVTNETSPSKSMPSVPSGLSEAPAVKVDVKPAESPETPAPLPGASTMIRVERTTGFVLEHKTAPPNSEQALSQDLSKTPTDKAAITSGKSEEKPVALPEPLPALKAKSDEELADDAPVEPSVVSTPEQVSENLLKKPVKVYSSPNADTQTSSEQDANKIAKAAGEIEVKSSPEALFTKKETVTNETSPSKSVPSVPSGLSEAPAAKVNVKSAESPETPAPLPGASTMIRAEIPTGCVPENKTTPPNSEKALSQDLSKTPTDKAAITSRKSEEKPVALPELLPALKAKSDEELADDAPVEPSVVSTPEQVSENLLKKPVKIDSSPNTDTQKSSEQDAKKVPKAAGEIEVKSSPEVPSTKKETVTNETSPSKSMPSVPSGLSEAPAVKVDVKPAESPETPAPLPGASTMIRAEIPTGCVPEDKKTPPNSEQALFQDLSQTPTDKAAITSGKSEEKPVALPEPSVVSTPEQVSENLLKKPVKVDSSPNTDTQTSSEKDVNKIAKAAGEIEVSSVDKETVTDEAIPLKGDPVPGRLSEAPGVKTDVKPTESQEDPVKTLESTADLNTNNMVKPVPSQNTSTSTFKQQIEKVTCKIVEEGEFEPIPDILTLHKATPVNETTTSKIEIPATDSWRKSPPAETLVKAAEREEDSAVPPEQVPAICTESDVHPLDDAAAFNQSDEATSEHAPKQMPALKKVLILGSSEDLRKIAEDLSSTKNNLRLFKNDICTYCNQIIDGKAKIVFSEPSVICHPECLKCGVCVKDLGSLEITMFLRDETIMCVDCYRKA
ncbi:nascent polypeptide-associated complex subunit alpha, muscle-specific form-like isoform X2 [Oryzias latipes]|uniref:nascent polypeptide-associated complex subunit alpha, muscle-specific form-like isoform X2 n=1 Tax=Oryzias latipes TaxID=8090 RepID=UPI000CE1A26D|nr:nascent polypeptide-associated complex subunit alpha, muscle-specific form-like isoform X2 [Oryzias latipes]